MEVSDARFSRHIGDPFVRTAHSSFLSGCEQMPSSAVVSPRLSLSVVVQCVYGPWAAAGQKRPSVGPDRRRLCGSVLVPAPPSSSWPQLQALPRPARSSDQACKAKAWEKNATGHCINRELMGQQPAGQDGVRGVRRSRVDLWHIIQTSVQKWKAGAVRWRQRATTSYGDIKG